MNDVVVGVDRSETARAAAHTAARFAAGIGAPLHIVTCAEPTGAASGGVGSDHFETDWAHDAEQFLKQLAFDLPHDSVTWSVGSGDPAHVIVEAATRLNAGTIVVGNRRVQGLARVLGSVASSVLKTASCNVLVAHTT